MADVTSIAAVITASEAVLGTVQLPPMASMPVATLITPSPSVDGGSISS